MNEQTLERCCVCDEPTGHAGQGEDSLYCYCGAGPFCHGCWDGHWCRDRGEQEQADAQKEIATVQGQTRILKEQLAEAIRDAEFLRSAHDSLVEVEQDYWWLLKHCQWSNVNGGQCFIVKGVGYYDKHPLGIRKLREGEAKND